MDEKQAHTVWAVTEGEYSDFRVLAVFETEEDAHAAHERGMGDSVDEMDYYATGVKPQRRELARLVVILDGKSGDIIDTRPNATGRIEDVYVMTNEIWLHPSRPRINKSVGKWWGHSASRPDWRVEVEGLNNDRTRKVFYDLVAKTRAEIVEGHR